MLPLERWMWDSFYPTETCWLFEGGGHPRYGKVGGTLGSNSPMYGKYAGMFAHRAAWTMLYGPIPPGMCVLHKCDVPKCVRPDHLFLGTQADNMADRDAKGRANWQRPGWRLDSRARLAKLTATQVAEIRRRYTKGSPQEPWTGNTGILAHEFGVHPDTILKIVRRKSWSHLP